MICKRCMTFDEENQKELLERYLSNMDPAIQCSDEVYVNRLSACDACSRMVNGMCSYCGCYVVMRAKKKHMDCPEPSGSRW